MFPLNYLLTSLKFNYMLLTLLGLISVRRIYNKLARLEHIMYKHFVA